MITFYIYKKFMKFIIFQVVKKVSACFYTWMSWLICAFRYLFLLRLLRLPSSLFQRFTNQLSHDKKIYLYSGKH